MNPQLNPDGSLRHLLTLDGLPRTILTHILDTAESFMDVGEREVKKVPLLRGKSIFNLFFEPSTRTRTTFEIAAVGLAGLVIPIADNQSSIVDSWHHIGSVINLGKLTLLRPEQLAESLETLIRDTPRRLAMAHAGHALVDGQGAVRVAQRLLAGVAWTD